MDFLKEYFWIYLALANLVAGIIFVSDKRKAGRQRYRVAEWRLHRMEFIGGVFAIFILMYLIRHKNRKASYYWITYLALAIWLAALWYLYGDSLQAFMRF